MVHCGINTDGYHSLYIGSSKVLNSTVKVFFFFQIYIKVHVCRDIIFCKIIIRHL